MTHAIMDDRRGLRILFVNQEYWPDLGGIQVLTRELARALRDRGNTVLVVANLSDQCQLPASEVDGIEVLRFPFNHALSSRDSRQILPLKARIDQLKQEFRPDIVHVNFPAEAAFFHLLSIKPGQSTLAA